MTDTQLFPSPTKHEFKLSSSGKTLAYYTFFDDDDDNNNESNDKIGDSNSNSNTY